MKKEVEKDKEMEDRADLYEYDDESSEEATYQIVPIRQKTTKKYLLKPVHRYKAFNSKLKYPRRTYQKRIKRGRYQSKTTVNHYKYLPETGQDYDYDFFF